MALYRELSAAAQAAYAELYDQVQAAEASRSPAFLTGKVGWKTIKGRRYGYWQFKEIDGRKREYYLGPEGPAVDAIERAMLRIAAYELLHRLDVPYRVVIDEALNTVKRFGSEHGHTYVNGVLDRAAAQWRSAEAQGMRR